MLCKGRQCAPGVLPKWFINAYDGLRRNLRQTYAKLTPAYASHGGLPHGNAEAMQTFLVKHAY